MNRILKAVSRRLLLPATGLLSVAAVLILTGPQPGAGAQAPRFPTAGGCVSGSPAGRFFVRIRVGPSVRSALVNVPPSAAFGKRLALVFAFHGAGGTGAFMEAYTGLSEVGRRFGFITVYPDALDNFWQLRGPNPQGEDDIEFTRSLLETLDKQLCVNDGRVYATGVSNGGGITARVGCELSDRFAAIAPVAGGYRALPPCHPIRRLSVLEVHGTADGIVPYNGRPPNGAGSVAHFLKQWTTLDNCPPGEPVQRRFAPRAQLLRRDGCAENTSVWHLRLVGGPHIWAGTPFVKRNRASVAPINTSLAVWRFFAAHPRTYSASGPGT